MQNSLVTATFAAYANRTTSAEHENASAHWNPGVFIDIDGVVLQGGKPFEWSKEAIKALFDHKIPFVFVTNGTYSSDALVGNLRQIFDLPFTANNCVVAPSPCAGLTDYHDKRVLVCCQDESIPLIEELGFHDYITIDQFSEIFPDLDYVDHQRRVELMKKPVTPELLKAQQEFRPIEVILLLGEPVKWERSLQLLIDVLMTNGDPRQKFKYVHDPHVPIIACNKDLTFKGAASLPRFGHGAFLECLQALYMKITKNELVYDELMGKPYLITYQYAASQLQKQYPNSKPINKFFIIGDNPEVDIKGANLFHENIKEPSMTARKNSFRSSRKASISIEPYLWNPGVSNQAVESILVCTGVYNPQNDMLYHLRKLIQRQASASGEKPNLSNLSISSPTSIRSSKPASPSVSAADANNNSVDVKKAGGDAGGSGSLMNSKASSSDVFDDENQRTIRPSKSYNSYPTLNMENDPNELNAVELSAAMSRRNSFISYFDDHLNVPDHTFENLKVAVDYVLDSLGYRKQE